MSDTGYNFVPIARRGRLGGDVTSARAVAAAQASYYVSTGIWSIVGRESFERITGPKRDYWLVRTVGGLAVAIGAALSAAVLTGREREAATLALASCAAFGAADVQAARASSRVYLVDAALHGLFATAWLRALRRS